MNAISSISGGVSGSVVRGIAPPLSPTGMPSILDGAGAGSSEPIIFNQLLLEAVQNVDGMQHQADQALKIHLAGGDVTQAEALTAFRKADLSMRMMLQIRNKLVDAFNEIKQLRM